MAEKSIKLNFIFNIIRNILNVIFPLITAPYIARVLEPDGVGLFNFASTYANYFALFAALGAGMYGIREIAKKRNSIEEETKFVSELCSLMIITTIICSIFYIVTLLFIPQLNENITLFLLAGFGLYFTPFKIDWVYQGKEEFGYITLRSFIIKILSIFALFIFVKDKQDLAIMVLINIASTTLNEMWNFIRLYRSGIHPHFTLHFTEHLKPMLVLFASIVAMSVYTMLDTLMLGFMTDYNEVGFYNNANHIAKTALPIATSLAAVVMPRLSYYTKIGEWGVINGLMKKSLSIVSFLCFPIMVAIIVIAPTFTPLFFGEMFADSIVPLQILAAVVVVIGLNNLLGVQILVGTGKDKQFLWAVLVGTFSNFVLNLSPIPVLGAKGAAISSVAAETLILIYEIWLVKKYTPIKLSLTKDLFYDLFISLGFIPIMAILSHYMTGWPLVVIFTFIGSIYYIIVQYMFKNPVVLEFSTAFISKIKSKM